MLRAVLSILIVSVSSQQWDPTQFPNPLRGGAKQCNMRSQSRICDSEEVLSMEGRYRLNNELGRISSRTEQLGSAFCSRKGTDAVLIIVRQGSKQLANDLNRLWFGNEQCKKNVVFLLSADDRHLYFSAQPNVDFGVDELQSIIDTNDKKLQSGDFVPVLTNIFKEVGKKTDIGAVSPPPDGSKGAISAILSALCLLVTALVAL
ncbi:unnamed protein product [Nippostrongylus brasiliensis]|uniref:TPM_phosphatase domain-containing protein n=1 Tax=Nippostrongylus brasiliensis TaxID=27835 RepID=A0A158R212_NIPBR|nr:unnamed protein product [Nippostrongylus brasiliensis]